METSDETKKKKAENCWEFWDCKIKKRCPAYITNSGRECWMVTNPLNKDSECPRAINKIMYCWECEWYKKLNSKAGEK